MSDLIVLRRAHKNRVFLIPNSEKGREFIQNEIKHGHPENEPTSISADLVDEWIADNKDKIDIEER